MNIEPIKNFRDMPSNPINMDYDCYRRKESFYIEDRKSIGFDFPYSKLINQQKVEVKSLKFKLLEKEYLVYDAFKDIVDEINNSKYILELENNWDGMGAVIVPHELYQRGIEVLIMYANFIFDQYNKTVIQSPEINPCPNGTLDFSWTTENSRMLINIKPKDDDYVASCFGYSKVSKIAIEGFVDMVNIDIDIASWMRKLKA